MIWSQPIFWGLLCGSLYFLVMWRIRGRRLAEQRSIARGLYALSEEIVASTTASELGSKLSARLPGLVNASSARLYLAQRGGGALELISSHASSPQDRIDFREKGQNLDQAVVLCFRNRTPLVIADTKNNSLVANADSSIPRSALLVPLVSHEEALGVIQIERVDRSGPFAAEEQAAAQHVANQVAWALKLQEQQSLREQLFRGEKLAATGTMISGIAAELTSPVGAISKLSKEVNLLLKRRDDLPAVEAGLTRMEAEAAKVEEIVGRMTSFQQDGASAPRELSLKATLERLTRNRESLWAEAGLVSELKFDNAPLTLFGAEGQLEQVVLTFLLYAEKRAASSTGRTFFVKSAESGDRIRVEIGCAAPGVSEDEVEPLTTGEDGGLSLDVCRTILRSHGGDVKIHRRSGVFAFEVTLPSVQRVVETVRTSAAPQGRPLTLMLVDPETSANRNLLKLLSSRGHRVVPVAGEEAAEVAPRLRFDAVFWAARPGRSGWGEFLERVRASIGSFVVISDGYSPELAASLEKNGGYLLSRPVEEGSLDRILGQIGEQPRS